MELVQDLYLKHRLVRVTRLLRTALTIALPRARSLAAVGRRMQRTWLRQAGAAHALTSVDGALAAVRTCSCCEEGWQGVCATLLALAGCTGSRHRQSMRGCIWQAARAHAGAQVSKHLLMETMDRDILAAVGCVPDAEAWRKKEIKENTKIYLTQRKCACPAALGSARHAHITSVLSCVQCLAARLSTLPMRSSEPCPRNCCAGSTCSGRRARALQRYSRRCTTPAPAPQLQTMPRAWCACSVCQGSPLVTGTVQKHQHASLLLPPRHCFPASIQRCA